MRRVVISAERPVLLNGIDAVVARGDLADRAIFLTLKAIPDVQRAGPSLNYGPSSKRARPQILGALLDCDGHGAASAVRTVRLKALPRMADFATWAVACEPAAFDEGAFMRAYTR